MPGAYRSPGKGLQQQSVLMLATQINLRPSLTAFLSSIPACLFALNCGRLDSEAHRISSRGRCARFERDIALCVEYAR